ncbi:contact-dependent growth inhibition system immunity protein [Pseudomonas lijiangensis]|uniref:contact-dependent growth inhibition system immunity protein n=1 Tax=Pseudomonas lijiangensis TaxID=2995658 RepID=UPI0031BA9FF0
MNHEFPVIKNVFSAYLNQDFDLEFGSADEAIIAFSSHVDSADKERALDELKLLLSSGLDEAQLRGVIFDKLGCCYFYPAEWSDGATWLKHVVILLRK